MSTAENANAALAEPTVDLGLVFDDAFIRELPELNMAWQPAPVPAPRLVALSRELANEVGLDTDLLESDPGVAVLSGNALPAGANPVAMGYAGHQFGGFSPRLGDGRALLLGEIVDPEGNHRDLHLKGSGRTPFARGGDGKATLGPMLREFLVAEAMHALGISTARALSVVVTGEQIQREQPEPGAVLTRLAASHIRVGTFEYAARMEDPTVMERLIEHSIARHYPHLADLTEGRELAFFEAVADTQAALIADWMLVGFIHGVMNTDNVTISGETIDYGPCAFMDRYDPATVYSSIDHAGRYAYGNQPSIAQWNLARFVETMLPFIDDDTEVAVDKATKVLMAFPDQYQTYWRAGMGAKLGLPDASNSGDAADADGDGDGELITQFLDILHAGHIDYTQAFRALAASLRGDAHQLESVLGAAAAGAWIDAWRTRLGVGDPALEAIAIADAMDAVNPIYVPRNHLLNNALVAANVGDMAPFAALLDAVRQPFVERDSVDDTFARPAPAEFDESFKTFCGT